MSSEDQRTKTKHTQRRMDDGNVTTRAMCYLRTQETRNRLIEPHPANEAEVRSGIGLTLHFHPLETLSLTLASEGQRGFGANTAVPTSSGRPLPETKDKRTA